MKVRSILSVLALVFIVASSFTLDSKNPPFKNKFPGLPLVLRGEVGTETGRSISIIPIEAINGEDGILHIMFLKPLGEVKVLVDGQLQETCQVTTEGQETEFSVAGWASGTYELEFQTTDGGYAYGIFVIE